MVARIAMERESLILIPDARQSRPTELARSLYTN